jgi:alpha-L-fucosidase
MSETAEISEIAEIVDGLLEGAKPMRSLLVVAFTCLLLAAGNVAGVAAAEAPDQRDLRLQWWREARFGMMMHWGLYSVPAGEWKGLEKQKDLFGEWIMERARIPVREYEPLAKQFNPVQFDAAEWAGIIRQSGMQYLVITAKHCDGFAMFKSRASRYNVVDATPFARDPMAELAAAVPKAGLRLGFYYSHCWDWHEPDALGNDNTWDFPDRRHKQVERYLRGKSMPQVRELVAQYRPSLMWFDVPDDITREQSAEFVNIIRSVVPDCIINDRVGNQLGDYATPEQHVPRRAPGGDFEVCMTLNNHWGFDRNDHAWKPAGQVIAILAETAGKGGNLLLNVGPTAEGRLPEPAVKILRDVGAWLERNGESIYGTQAGPLPECSWGWCTAKADTLYLHVLRWPADGRILVPGLKNDIRGARLLANRVVALQTERVGERDWLVHVPAPPPDPLDSVLALTIAGAPRVDRTFVLDPLPGAASRLSCWAAEIHGRSAKRTDLSCDNASYDAIHSWTNAQDWLSWSFRTPRAATYDVSVTYAAAADSAGNKFTLRVGDRQLTGAVQSTGGPESFKEFRLGAIDIPQAERVAAELRPGSITTGSALMTFHVLTFRPATTKQ